MTTARDNRLRCAKWCGRGCTQAEYERARKRGRRLAAKLGKGWKLHVHENMGWHAEVRSRCGRIRVTVHHYLVGGATYTAYVGPKDDPGGRWISTSDDPKLAVTQACGLARRDAEAMAALVKGLP